MGPFETAWSLLPPYIATWLCAYYHALTHVELVTKSPDGAWLFRSGGPWTFPRGWLSAPVMTSDSIRGALRDASLKSALAGSPPELLPWDVRLFDINLLTADADKQYIDVESAFFADQQNQGDILVWPMNGVMPRDMAQGCHGAGLADSACPVVTRQPRDVANATIRRQLAASFPSWDRDSLSHRVEELHGLVRRLKNTAIFFHCSCGCDRTGQLFAAYAMSHLNWTVQEALKHNTVIAGRPLWYEHQVSIQWHCEWLRTTGRYAHDDCGVCVGDVLCAPAEYYLDPFARQLEERVAIAVLVFALGMLFFAFALYWRGRHCRRHDSHLSDLASQGLASALLTPRPIPPKVGWPATPNTLTPGSSMCRSLSPWSASSFCVDRAEEVPACMVKCDVEVEHDSQATFQEVL